MARFVVVEVVVETGPNSEQMQENPSVLRDPGVRSIIRVPAKELKPKVAGHATQ
ncbi:MAG: hypothetical protein ACRBBQ_01970 [Cognatishimia sp.]